MSAGVGGAVPRRRTVVRFGTGALLAVLLASPVLLLPIEAHAADIRISASDQLFEPKNRSINPGDRVKWGNDGNLTHSVVFNNGSIDREITPGQETEFFTFNSTGTFTYYCRFHGTPAGDNMAGSITVTTGSTSSPSPMPTGTITITITPTPTPTPTQTRRTSTPTPTTASPTPSPSPTPTPSPTFTTPTPSPTPSDFAQPIPTFTSDETGGTSAGNTQAIIAIVVVAVLGILGFVVYRQTLSR